MYSLLNEIKTNVVYYLENSGFGLVTAIVAFLFGVLIIKNILQLVKVGVLACNIDSALVHFILTIVKYVLYLCLILYCLSAMGLPLSGFVSAISALTLAIGISVKELTLMHTVLATGDNKKVMIPNSKVFSSDITNYSANEYRRVIIPVEVDYNADYEAVQKLLLKVANSHPLVCSDPAPTARYNFNGDSAVHYDVKVWCRNKDYWPVSWDLSEQLYMAVFANKIDVPYPQITVSYRKED